MRQFSYDDLGRNTAELWYNNVTDADADQNRLGTISFTYDGAGQMLSASDWEATYNYVYDNLGRTVQITQTISGLQPVITFSQQYDAAGRRTRLVSSINGTPDFKNWYFYDPLGRLSSLKQAQQTGGSPVARKLIDFSYDAAGQLATLTRYADTSRTQLVAQTDYGYDQTGRLTDMTHLRGETTFVDYGWSFDAANRMTQYVNSIDGTANYTNDPTGQLTAADYDYQGDESYLYDENGNRLSANGSTYIIGANNQLLSDGTYRYLYDAEGNCTYRFIDNNQNGQLDQGDSEITEYTWDNRDRLRKVQYRPNYGAAVDWVIRYSYDYQNRLVRKRADMNGDGDYEDKQVFAYDGNQIVLDFQRTGSGLVQAGDLQGRYLWGPAVDQILAEEEVDNGADETVQWTLTDHLNTVRDIAKYDPATDTTSIVNHLLYDAFGRVTSESNPAVDSLFLFTARPFDSDTKLQNNLNRWYDPVVGRWLSEDPIGFDGGDGNLYRYVGNGPSRRIDSLGLREPEDPHDALMLGLITQAEANYFYSRSPEELREYIRWRLREGRDDGSALLFLRDFLTGAGDTIRYYGQASPDTWQMRESPGGRKLREAFYAGGCRTFTKMFDYGTWDAAIEAGPLAPQYWMTRPFQVGGFLATAINNGDGTVTFIITNVAGLESFGYHLLPNKPTKTGPMRTITQYFVWTERIDWSQCSCPGSQSSVGLDAWEPWNKNPWSSAPLFFFERFPRVPRVLK